MKNLLICIILSFSFLGCANFGRKLKSFLRGEDASKQSSNRSNLGKKFSQSSTYLNGPRRKYSKRTSHGTFQNESEISDKSGSLWIMEGQGGYLFSQNIMRMIGDPLPVKIEGEPKEQLEAKTKVIVGLVNKLERRKVRARRLATEAKNAAQKAINGKNKGKATKPKEDGEKKEEKFSALESKFPVKTVPTRIVERLVDGNYRVKGSQTFMIGKREYKTIVTGIVRAEDFSENGISAAKLLDRKVDIVSKRRRESTL